MKRKFIISILLLMCLFLILNLNEASAFYSIGTKLTVDVAKETFADIDLNGPNAIAYCIQAGQPVKSGTQYTVTRYAYINGRGANIDIGKNENGNYVDGETKYIECDENAIMAYIISQPNGDGSQHQNEVYSAKQKAIYNYFGTWAKKVGFDVNLGITSGWYGDDPEVITILNNAREYAKSLTEQTASIKNNNAVNDSFSKQLYEYQGEEYIKVGPFNWEYTGNIDSVNVYDQNSKELNVKYAKYDGGSLKISDNASGIIKSNTGFYILINTKDNVEKISRITAKVKATKDVIRAEIVGMETDATTNGRDDQNLIAINIVANTEQQTTEDSLEMNDIDLLGSINILKRDSVTGNVLDNVYFTIRMLTGSKAGQYISVDDNGNAVYTTEEVRVKTVNGLINIQNAYFGEYELTEVENENYGYEDLPRVIGTYSVNMFNTVQDDKRVIKDGVYEIESALDSNKVVDLFSALTDNGTNIQLYTRNNTYSQRFYIKYVGDGYYKITVLIANKNLDVANGGTEPGTNVWVYEDNDTDAQKWRFDDAGNGYYYINSKLNNLNLDVDSAMTADGTNIRVFTPNQTNAQKFKFNNLDNSMDSSTNGTVQVVVENTRKYIQLSGYVWEDMISSKSTVRDYLYTEPDTDERNRDRLVANVTVKLKDREGNAVNFKILNENGDYEVVQETKTDENGSYRMYDILIDEIDNYYVEFTYNGMSYTTVPIVDISYNNASKALEGDERTRFNNEYAQITDDENNVQNVGQANNSNGEMSYNINYDYDTQNQKSSVNYGPNSVYGYDGQSFPINGTDEQYLITATTYNGYVSVGGSGYLSDIYTAEYIKQNGITEIENINMGLYQREQPDLSVAKDIERANVSVAGAEHIYRYADRFNEELWSKNGLYGVEANDLEPQVKFQQEGAYGSMSYTRYLYASDIMYKDGENADDKLSVKMTYVISVKNQATKLNAQIYELEDYYDTKYVNIVGIGTEMNSDGSIKEGTEIEYYEPGESIGNYNKIVIGENNEPILELEPETKKNIYVQLEVNRDNIKDILEGNVDVKLDNVVEINKYGTTIVNEQGQEEIYAGIDKDSQPGNMDVTDRTTYEDDTDSAPGMMLKLQEERQINGKVFLDEDENALDAGKRTHAGVERQGDGKYNVGESSIKNVQVTLKNPDGSTAQFYNEDTGNFENAVTYTDENGDYTFEGFVPGDYYITYTWGGDIVNGENSTYIDAGGNEQTINVQNYKSTVVNETVWNQKESNDQWYKDSFKQNYDGIEWDSSTGTEIRNSDAVDDWNKRLEIDNEIGEVTYSEKQKLENTYNGNPDGGETYANVQMDSNTPEFVVNLEYADTTKENPDTNTTDQRDEFEQNADGTLAKDQNGDYISNGYFTNTLKNIDFGIIERARQILELDKEITAVKITLANSNVIVNAQLVDGQLRDETQYVTVMPPSDANNGQIKIEIDQELIQGATIDIEYGLKVTNTSELDYQTQEFYMYGNGYGEVETSLVTLQPTLLIDYIDNNMSTESEDHENWTVIPQENRADYLYDVNSNPDGLLSKGLESTLNSTIKVITTEQLKDIILKPIGNEIDTSVTAMLNAHKLLSNNDETFLENHAEIIRVKRNNGGAVLTTIPGNYEPGNTYTSEEDDSESPSVTVVPPTGLTTNTISYIIIAISSLGILVAGIILIKKFVIK